jgi:hypothetical protein
MLETRTEQLLRLISQPSLSSLDGSLQMYSTLLMTVLSTSTTALAWGDQQPHGACGVTYMCGCYGGGPGFPPVGGFSFPPAGCSSCSTGPIGPGMGTSDPVAGGPGRPGYYPPGTELLYYAPPDLGPMPPGLPPPANNLIVPGNEGELKNSQGNGRNERPAMTKQTVGRTMHMGTWVQAGPALESPHASNRIVEDMDPRKRDAHFRRSSRPPQSDTRYNPSPGRP